MRWLNECSGRVEHDVPLAELTWFGLGGPAAHVVHPAGPGELGEILRRALAENAAVKVLGGGANVLVRDDGFDGVVVRLDDAAFGRVTIDGNRVRVGAGASLVKLVRHCSREGLAGLAGLAGIPGTVGGAIRMNAGGRYGEVGDVVESMEVVESDGRRREITRDEVGFAYRRTALGDAQVTAATFRLRPDDPRRVYSRFREVWRDKRQSQPLGRRSAGCIFTNPPGESAGRLIDRAGWKGASVGGAHVSSRHANFIIGERGVTAEQVLELIARIRQRVRQESGVELELEIDVW